MVSMDTDAINTLDEAVVAHAPLRVVRTCSYAAISPRQLHSSTTRKIDTLDDKEVYCARGCVRILGIPAIWLSSSGPFGVWGQLTMLVIFIGRDI